LLINSFGPFLQLLDITGVFVAAASTNTNPGSSHLEVNKKQSDFS